MNSIQEKKVKYQEKIAKYVAKIGELQKTCSHEGVNITYDSDTGNYCKSDDSYWIDWYCPHCNKMWKTDQDKEANVTILKLKAVVIKK